MIRRQHLVSCCHTRQQYHCNGSCSFIADNDDDRLAKESNHSFRFADRLTSHNKSGFAQLSFATTHSFLDIRLGTAREPPLVNGCWKPASPCFFSSSHLYQEPALATASSSQIAHHFPAPSLHFPSRCSMAVHSGAGCSSSVNVVIVSVWSEYNRFFELGRQQ